MNTQSVVSPPKLLGRKSVTDKVALSRASIYGLISQGKFPRSIKLTTNRVAWLESEVDMWIAERVSASKVSAKAGVQQ